jgi:hypothetical protein
MATKRHAVSHSSPKVVVVVVLETSPGAMEVMEGETWGGSARGSSRAWSSLLKEGAGGATADEEVGEDKARNKGVE